MRMEIIPYPEDYSTGQYTFTNPPTWCPGCKTQINPEDPSAWCGGDFVGFWTCPKAGCYEFVNSYTHVPFRGPIFRNPLFQHARFMNHQKTLGYDKNPYLHWSEWCWQQPDLLGLDGVYSYADEWLKFPEPFLEDHQ